MSRNHPLLSVIVPVYNESGILPAFHARLRCVLDSLSVSSEVLYVNDGSTDDSLSCLLALRNSEPNVGITNLSRNFGKEIAMSAGLDAASGEAVVIIDADLQDPPELIPRFIDEWRKGYDVVYGKRTSRAGESALKKVSALLFYRLCGRLGGLKMPADTGDFRLLSRRAVESLRTLREQHRFMKGLFAWIGYNATAVPYQRDARYGGHTKFNYWKLWNFALEGFTSFTTTPLKVASYLGLLVAASAFVYGTVVVVRTMVYGNPVPGYPSLLVIMLFLGGVQLVALGVIGEYVGRMFDETKQRPLYIVQDFYKPSGRTARGTPRKISATRTRHGQFRLTDAAANAGVFKGESTDRDDAR